MQSKKPPCEKSGARVRLKKLAKESCAILIISLCSFCAIFLVGELCVRLFAPGINLQITERRLKKEDAFGGSTTGWVPGAKGSVFGVQVEIDEHGFRKMDHPETARTWLLLGDSVAFGVGVKVEDTFACHLQKEHGDTNIINSSAVGQGVQDYHNVALELFSGELDIERVVMFYCLNDVYSFREAPRKRRGFLRHAIKRTYNYIFPRSKFFVFLKSLLYDSSWSNFQFDLSFYKADNSDFLKCVEEIRQTVQLCESNGADFVLVLMPYEGQLRAKNDNTLYRPQLLLKETLADEIKIIDTIDTFLSDQGKSSSYFLYSDPMHLSVRGHKMIFNALVPHL